MRLAKIFISAATAVLIVSASHPSAAATEHRGVVMDAVTGGGYTYMNIEENGEQIWMPNFTSKALRLTFDKILFVSGVDDGLAGAQAPAGAVEPAEPEADEELSDEDLSDDEAEPAPVDGIYTIEQLYYRADELKGQIIKVRGKVVKVSENIMGRTWVHIQDGSGTKGKNKLVFRSANDTAKVGETVVAEGRLDTDKDFGFGYYYSVIVEDAKFTKEKAGGEKLV